MEDHYYDDEQILEQYSLMAQAEANVRIRDSTGFSMTAWRAEQEQIQQSKANSNKNVNNQKGVLSNLRFIYPNAGSRPQPELPERRSLVFSDDHHTNYDNNGRGGFNNSFTNGTFNTTTSNGNGFASSSSSSLPLSSSSSLPILSNSFSHLTNSNSGIGTSSSSGHNHNNGGNVENGESNRPKEAQLPPRRANRRFVEPPRPPKVPELCHGVVVNSDDEDDDEDDDDGDEDHQREQQLNYRQQQQQQENLLEESQSTGLMMMISNDGNGNNAAHRFDSNERAVGLSSSPSLSLPRVVDVSTGVDGGDGNNGNNNDNNNTVGDNIDGVGRTVSDAYGHSHNNNKKHEFHVVPCLSCGARLRVNVLALLVSCPECKTVNPSIGDMDELEQPPQAQQEQQEEPQSRPIITEHQDSSSDDDFVVVGDPGL
jgi:hypothetical protein